MKRSSKFRKSLTSLGSLAALGLVLPSLALAQQPGSPNAQAIRGGVQLHPTLAKQPPAGQHIQNARDGVQIRATLAAQIEEQYNLAAGHYQRAQYSEATAAFQRLLGQHQSFAKIEDANFFLAESWMQQYEFDKAYAQFRTFLTRYSGHRHTPRAMFRMGEAAYRTEKHQVALRLIEEFIRKYPQHELNQFALPYLGQIRNLRGEPQLAKRAFEVALQLYPGGSLAPDCRLGLGKSLLQLGNTAGHSMLEALAKSETVDPEIATKANIELGIAAFVQSTTDYESATKWLQRAIETAQLATDRATAKLWLARVQRDQNNLDAAYELIEPMAGMQLEKKLKFDLLSEGAFCAAGSGHELDALVWLNELRTQFPHADNAIEAVQFEIRILRRLKRTDEALALAVKFELTEQQQAIQIAIDDARGRQQYADQAFAESMATFDGLLEQYSDQDGNVPVATWQYFKALNQIGLEKFADAEITLASITSEKKSSDLSPLIDLSLASVQFRQRKYADAIANYQSYLDGETNPADSISAQLELAICLAKTGEHSRADETLEMVLAAEVNGNDELATANSDEIEQVIELLAASAAAADQQDIAGRWYRHLADHAVDASRKNRAQNRLAVASLDIPIEQQTPASLAKLFKSLPENKAVVTATIERAKQFEALDQPAKAAELYDLLIDNAQAVSINVISAVQLKQARLLQQLGGKRNLTKAAERLNQWLEQGPESGSRSGEAKSLDGDALYQLAWIQRDLGNRAQARTRFQQLVRQHTSSKYWPDAAYRLLTDAMADKDYEVAKTLIDSIESHDDVPTEIVARSTFYSGKIAVASQDWPAVERAMSKFANFPASESLQATAKYFLAESLFQQSDYGRAKIQFDQIKAETGAIDAGSDSPGASLSTKFQAWVWLRMAQLQSADGDHELAAKTAAAAKKRFAKFESAHEYDFLIARGLESQGLLSDARSGFQQVIDSTTGSKTETAAHAQWRIGETYFHQEKFADAVAAYYKVESLYGFAKWRSAALVQAGKCQEHLKNPANAIKLYRQLVQRYPDSDFAAEALQRMAKLDGKQVAAKKTGSRQLGKHPKASLLSETPGRDANRLRTSKKKDFGSAADDNSFQK